MKPIFITLHDNREHTFEVNANLITYLYRMLRENKTVVHFNKEDAITITETPEEIKKLISESN